MRDRFVALPTGDQGACVWVVDHEKLDRLMEEGLIMLTPAELSMLSGKAAEKAAIERLGSEIR